MSNPDVGAHFAAIRQARPCGECTACCTVMAVTELQKPRGQACAHICAGGCAIYSERPDSCRRFDCLWRLGFARDDDRPDRLGVIFDVTPRDRDCQIQAIMAFEARPGAFTDPKVRYQLDRHAKKAVVLLMVPGRIEPLGPPGLVARWQQSRSRAALGL
ncbi:MAG TPA: hypothetical protein PKW35_21035 [Nannocystaceae bacterium]|nr:hypothetical protein [Nannocystaceae bacterium]